MEDEKKSTVHPPKCIICGAELPSAQMCYCDKHRAEAEKDWQAYKDADAEMFVPLAAAILRQVMSDYRTALGALYNDPLDKRKLGIVLAKQKYIRSDNFATLTMGISDPERVIEIARDTVTEHQEAKRQEDTLRAARRLNAETLEKLKELRVEVADLKKLVTNLRKELSDVRETVKSESGER